MDLCILQARAKPRKSTARTLPLTQSLMLLLSQSPNESPFWMRLETRNYPL